METQTLFTCLGKKKEKTYPDDPKMNHIVFYDCVAGDKYWDKAKLFPETHVLHLITIDKYQLKDVEISKEEGKKEE